MRFIPCLAVLSLLGCGPTWNPDRDGVPQLARALPFDVAVLARISRFRSGTGHDFSDGVERCRSMKHYLWPVGGDPGAAHAPSWTTLEVRAPAAGRFTRIDDDGSFGKQLYLESTENPAFTFRLFHVAPEPGIVVGREVDVGTLLGHHAGDGTYSDVAVEARQTLGARMVSFVEMLTDDAFAPLQARGVANRQALVISREERDAAPLSCNGEQFTQRDSPSDWVELR